MAGGRRVEQDVIVGRGSGGVAQDFRELVEGGDLRGAGPGKLLLHGGDHGIRQNAPYGGDHALPVGAGRFLRIDVQGREPGCLGDRQGHPREGDAQDFIKIGGWIRADQQHPFARFGQADGRGAGGGGLADTAFASEKQKAWRMFNEFHGDALSTH